MQKNKYFSEIEFQIASQCNKALYLHYTQAQTKTPENRLYRKNLEEDWKSQIKNQFHKKFSDGVDLIRKPEEYPIIDVFSTNKKTIKAIEDGERVVKDAVFCDSNFISRIDVLTQLDNNLDIHLFSRATMNRHILPLEFAYKCFIIEKSGYKFDRCFIYFIDNTYVKNGPIDPHKLFTPAIDFTKEIRERFSLIYRIIKKSHKILCTDEEPFVHIGPHCDNCSFYNYCSKHIPKDSFFFLPRQVRSRDRWQYYESGNLHMKDIIYQLQRKSNFFRKSNAIQAVIENKEIIDFKNIKEFCENINSNDNIYLLDLDASSSPVPLEDGLKPYELNMISYTIIKENQNKLCFFQKINNSTLKEFVKSLIESFQESGPILGYNIGFIRARFSQMIKYVPEYSEQIKDIIDRLIELKDPFNKGWYVSPKMRGSISYINVLQAEAFYNAPYKPRITIQMIENIAKAILKQKDDEYFIKFLSLSKKDALDKWQVWIGLRDIGNKTKLIKKTNK